MSERELISVYEATQKSITHQGQKRIHHFCLIPSTGNKTKEKRINLKSINVNYYCCIHVRLNQALLVFADDS
jgi:hypothetical protein